MPITPLKDAELEQYFQSAAFQVSAAKFNQCPAASAPEIAFAGRSNAGKSSAINRITGQKNLARTSKTPGRTQLINFFCFADQHQLVDLPGYGYAKVSREKKHAWQVELEKYLEQRDALAALVLVMDIRNPLQHSDQILLDWVRQYQMSCHILLTKSDKLKKGPALQARFAVEKQLAGGADHITVQPFSANKGSGLSEARRAIYALLHPHPA